MDLLKIRIVVGAGHHGCFETVRSNYASRLASFASLGLLHASKLGFGDPSQEDEAVK